MKQPSCMRVDALRPFERNPRTISKGALESLKRSLQDDPGLFEVRPLLCRGEVDGLAVDRVDLALGGLSRDSATSWPVLDHELGHREILRIPGRERGANTNGSRGDKAVCLAQCGPLGSEVTSPASGELAFLSTERCDAKAPQQPADRRLLPTAGAAPQLLDVDGADVRRVCYRPERLHPIRGLSSAERINQHGGVQEQGGHASSADATRVEAPLVPHPCGGVRVPLVPDVRDLP